MHQTAARREDPHHSDIPECGLNTSLKNPYYSNRRIATTQHDSPSTNCQKRPNHIRLDPIRQQVTNRIVNAKMKGGGTWKPIRHFNTTASPSHVRQTFEYPMALHPWHQGAWAHEKCIILTLPYSSRQLAPKSRVPVLPALQSFAMTQESRQRERLGEHVSHLMLRIDMLYKYELPSNVLTEMMVLNVDVLGAGTHLGSAS